MTGAKQFAKTLAEQEKMFILHGHKNDGRGSMAIDDNELKALCEALKQNTNITFLRLEGSISLQGLRYLFDLLTVNKYITNILLEPTRLTTELFQSLKSPQDEQKDDTQALLDGFKEVLKNNYSLLAWEEIEDLLPEFKQSSTRNIKLHTIIEYTDIHKIDHIDGSLQELKLLIPNLDTFCDEEPQSVPAEINRFLNVFKSMHDNIAKNERAHPYFASFKHPVLQKKAAEFIKENNIVVDSYQKKNILRLISEICHSDWKNYVRVGSKVDNSLLPDGVKAFRAAVDSGEDSCFEDIIKHAKYKHSNCQLLHSIFRGRDKQTNLFYKILSGINMQDNDSMERAFNLLVKFKNQMVIEPELAAPVSNAP